MCASRDIQQRSPQSSFRQTSEHGARRDDAQPWMIAKVSSALFPDHSTHATREERHCRKVVPVTAVGLEPA